MRALRPLAYVAALLAAILVGVAGASAFVDASGQDTPVGPATVQPDGSAARLAVTATDPAGRQPWAIRVYRSQAGWTCPEAGRVQDGDFGQVDADGVFRPSTVQAAGSCIDLDKAPVSVTVNRYPANGDRGARAIIFGVVSSDVSRISARIAGRNRELAVTNGTYMAVAADRDLTDAAIEITLTDGSTKTYVLRPSDSPAIEAAVGR
jgi:hypothetical protein